MPSFGLNKKASVKLILPDVSLVLFILGINIIFLFHIQVGLKIYVTSLLKYIGHYLLFLSLLCSIYEGKLNNIKPVYQRWLLFFALTSLYIVIVGFINRNHVKSAYYMSSDVLAFSYFSAVFVASKKGNWKYLEPVMWAHFIIVVVLCAFSVLKFNGPFLIEKVIFSPVYYWWGLIYGWIYFLVTINKRGVIGKLFTFGSLTGFFILDIFFLKRNPLAILFLCALISFLAYNPCRIIKGIFKSMSSGRSWLYGISAILIIFGGIKISGLDTFGERYKGYGLPQFKRKLTAHGGFIRTSLRGTRLKDEPYAVLHSATTFEIMSGRGAGATIPVDSAHSPTGSSGDLHSGFAKIMLKGGVVFLFAWSAGWLLLVRDFIKNSDAELIPFYTIVTAKGLMLPVSTFFAWSLEFGLFLLCAGRCMARD